MTTEEKLDLLLNLTAHLTAKVDVMMDRIVPDPDGEAPKNHSEYFERYQRLFELPPFPPR